jgi:hypothetical protein
MESYIVLYFKPLDKKRIVKTFETESLDIAKKLGNSQKKYHYDVIIVKKIVKNNEYTNKEDVFYEIQKFGYYNVYNIMNYIIFALTFIIVSFFCYLYFGKFFTNH